MEQEKKLFLIDRESQSGIQQCAGERSKSGEFFWPGPVRGGLLVQPSAKFMKLLVAKK